MDEFYTRNSKKQINQQREEMVSYISKTDKMSTLEDHNLKSSNLTRKSILKGSDNFQFNGSDNPFAENRNVTFKSRSSHYSQRPDEKKSEEEDKLEQAYLQILEKFYVECVQEHNALKDNSISSIGRSPFDFSIVDNMGEIITSTQEKFQ